MLTAASLGFSKSNIEGVFKGKLFFSLYLLLKVKPKVA